MQSRRDFIKIAAGSALALSAGACTKSSEISQEWRNRQSGMDYRALGNTGFMVSGVVMGGNEISVGNYDHVLRALDTGLNYLDTAPAYGRGKSEEGYAKVIQSRPRDTFFLNSKVSVWSDNRNELYQSIFESLAESEQKKLKHLAKDRLEARKAVDPDYLVQYFNGQARQLEGAALSNVMEMKYGRQIDRGKNYSQLIIDSVEESLTRLGTDHLDLMMCPHGASTAEEILNYPETFEAFEILKKAGKVRRLGVSSHNDPAGVLEAAAQDNPYSVSMIACNIVNYSYVEKALEKAAKKGIGVIAMKVARAVHPGPGRGEVDPSRITNINAAVEGSWKLPQKAYLWALKNPNISAVISNMVTHDHVRDNLILPQAVKAA